MRSALALAAAALISASQVVAPIAAAALTTAIPPGRAGSRPAAPPQPHVGGVVGADVLSRLAIDLDVPGRSFRAARRSGS
jgi:hypothetical protein